MPTGVYARKSALDRIFDRVIFDPNDCWIWQGSRSHGYGVMGINNKVRLVHRVAFEIFKHEIPSGMFLCHHCDVPACCNPDHMFIGTQKDNMRDCSNKKRAVSGNQKLSDCEVKEIRKMAKEGKTYRHIASAFFVTSSNVSLIVNNKSRKGI